MAKKLPSIISPSKLKELNKGKKWKIRCRLNSKKYWVLYLHKQTIINGKIKSDYKSDRRKFIIFGTELSNEIDREVLQKFSEWRDIIEYNEIAGSLGIKLKKDPDRILFLDYANKILDKKRKSIVYGTVKVFNNLFMHWKGFCDDNDYFLNEIDRDLAKDFADYLLGEISKNTANLYWGRFRYIFEQAIDDEIIELNPTRKILIKMDKTKPKFLTVEDVILLERNHDPTIQTQAAYLFSIYQGTRFSDISNLKFDDIKQVMDIDGKLHNVWDLQIKKTKELQRIYLSDDALRIINQMRKINKFDYVFSLPSYPTVLSKLREWARNAGVLPFTFHTARHTWASLNTSINDIRYVQQGLGHTNISMTEKYAHLQLDKKLEGTKRFSDYLNKAREVYEEK